MIRGGSSARGLQRRLRGAPRRGKGFPMEWFTPAASRCRSLLARRQCAMTHAMGTASAPDDCSAREGVRGLWRPSARARAKRLVSQVNPRLEPRACPRANRLISQVSSKLSPRSTDGGPLQGAACGIEGLNPPPPGSASPCVLGVALVEQARGAGSGASGRFTQRWCGASSQASRGPETRRSRPRTAPGRAR